MEDKRIEEITEILQGVEESRHDFVQPTLLLWYRDHVSYLLSKVEELEKELGKYKIWYEEAAKDCAWAEARVDELEKDNARLDRKLQRIAQGVIDINNEKEMLTSKLAKTENHLAEIQKGEG